MWVTQRLREFLELYPDIRIELVLSDEQIAIAMRAADVAIWTSEPQQSDLIRRPLFTMKIHAYASAQYIRRNGAPQTIDDLDDHPIVSYSGTPAMHLSAIRWLETAGLDGKPPRKPAFAANSVLAMKYAIRAGIGIGLIPDYLTGEESELVPVLRGGAAADGAGLLRLSRGAEDAPRRCRCSAISWSPRRASGSSERSWSPVAMHMRMASMRARPIPKTAGPC